MKVSESCGGVIVRDGLVAVVNQHDNSWSFPKGHVDSGEERLECAKREIFEECGISDLTLIKEFPHYERFRISRGARGEDKSTPKLMIFFLFTTKQSEFVLADPIHPEARWVPIDEVSSLLTHPKDKEFFESIKNQLKNHMKEHLNI